MEFALLPTTYYLLVRLSLVCSTLPPMGDGVAASYLNRNSRLISLQIAKITRGNFLAVRLTHGSMILLAGRALYK